MNDFELLKPSNLSTNTCWMSGMNTCPSHQQDHEQASPRYLEALASVCCPSSWPDEQILLQIIPTPLSWEALQLLRAGQPSSSDSLLWHCRCIRLLSSLCSPPQRIKGKRCASIIFVVPAPNSKGMEVNAFGANGWVHAFGNDSEVVRNFIPFWFGSSMFIENFISAAAFSYNWF